MKKDEILFIRIMSIAAIMAAMVLLLIFGCGNGLFGNIVKQINNNTVDINSADASIYNLYFYKGINAIYLILFSVTLFSTLMAVVFLLKRHGMAYITTKTAAVSVIVTSLFIIFAKISEGSILIHRIINWFYIGKIDDQFETAHLMGFPVVPVILIILSVLLMCLIKSSSLRKIKTYSSAGIKKVGLIGIPMLFGCLYFEFIREVVLRMRCEAVSANAELTYLYTNDYYIGDRFVFNISYAVFILAALIIAVLLKGKLKNAIAVIVPVLISLVAGIIYYLNPKPLFGYLTLDEGLCDSVEAAAPLYIILFVLDIFILVFMEIKAFATELSIKNILITILINIVISILSIFILGNIFGLAGMYAGCIASNAIALLYSFYAANVGRSHH